MTTPGLWRNPIEDPTVEKASVRIVAGYRDRNVGRLERGFSYAVWLVIVAVVLGGMSMRGLILICMSIALVTLLGLARALIRDARLTMVVAEMVSVDSPGNDQHARLIGDLLDASHPLLKRALQDEDRLRSILAATARRVILEADPVTSTDCSHGHTTGCAHRRDLAAWRTWIDQPNPILRHVTVPE
jgi:hypothetical protein